MSCASWEVSSLIPSELGIGLHKTSPTPTTRLHWIDGGQDEEVRDLKGRKK
jgi:hypothetical protein